MSSNAFNFFVSTVKPTLEEFLTAPYDIRRGRLAAIVLSHMTDYWALEGYTGNRNFKEMKQPVDELRKTLSKQHPDYSLIIDIADASKHALLATDKTKRFPDSSTQVTRTAGIFDAPLGFFAEACVVEITFEDGTSKSLVEPIKSVLQMWNEKLSANER